MTDIYDILMTKFKDIIDEVWKMDDNDPIFIVGLNDVKISHLNDIDLKKFATLLNDAIKDKKS